jgi:hypothetical protein
MPSLAPTEEDLRNAQKAMLFNMGLGMLGNANRGDRAALGAGMLGGVNAYQQGMGAPMQRLKQQMTLLDFQGKGLGNQKTMAELSKMQREEDQATKQQDFLSMLTNPGRAAMAGGGGPSLANLNTGQNYQNNPAAMLADPRINLQALAAGIDPKRLGSAMENTRPFAMEAGKTYQYADGRERYMPQIDKGMTFDASGRVSNAPGYADAMYAQEQTRGMAGVLPDQLRQAFALNNAPVTEVTSGRQTRAGIGNPVIGLPAQYGGQQQGGQQGAQVALTPNQQSAQTNLQKGNDFWREKTLAPIVEAGSSARGVIDNIQALRGVNLNTGAGTELLGNLANFGALFGIPNAEKYATDVQRFQALAMESVNRELNQAKGPQTDQDALRAQKIFAQLRNTPAANEFILDYREAAARAQQARAQFYEAAHARALERGISNLSQVDTSWRKISRSIWEDPAMQKWAARK